MVGAAGYEETLPGDSRLLLFCLSFFISYFFILLLIFIIFIIFYFLGYFGVPRPHCRRLPRIPQFQVCVMLIVAQLDYHLYFNIQKQRSVASRFAKCIVMLMEQFFHTLGFFDDLMQLID